MAPGSASGPAPPPDESIRINLTLPVLRFGIGPFQIDPVEQFVGAKIADILESLKTGSVFRRPSAAGPAVEVYPLALPEGEGASVPLGQFGELGFQNREGLLVLTVPLPFSGWVRQRLGDAVVRGPVEGLSLDGAARVAHFAIRVRAGSGPGGGGRCGGEVGSHPTARFGRPPWLLHAGGQLIKDLLLGPLPIRSCAFLARSACEPPGGGR